MVVHELGNDMGMFGDLPLTPWDEVNDGVHDRLVDIAAHVPGNDDGVVSLTAAIPKKKVYIYPVTIREICSPYRLTSRLAIMK
jgi:hypothetical protein